jgi:hypothetical protein
VLILWTRERADPGIWQISRERRKTAALTFVRPTDVVLMHARLRRVACVYFCRRRLLRLHNGAMCSLHIEKYLDLKPWDEHPPVCYKMLTYARRFVRGVSALAARCDEDGLYGIMVR